MAHKFTNLDNERVIWYHIDKYFVRKSKMPVEHNLEINFVNDVALKTLIDNAFTSQSIEQTKINDCCLNPNLNPYDFVPGDGRPDSAGAYLSDDSMSIANIQRVLSLLKNYQSDSEYSFSPRINIVNKMITYTVLGAVFDGMPGEEYNIIGFIVNDPGNKGLVLLKINSESDGSWKIEAYAYSHNGPIDKISKDFIDRLV